MIVLNVNGQPHSLDVEPEIPLLWVLRDTLGLTGTKYGCGIATCGACVVHVNDEAVPACQIPVGSVADAKIVTIEGLSGTVADAVRTAWLEFDVPQCGYCQPGQVMGATALLSARQKPTDPEIDETMHRHLCRCATYYRIRAAIHAASRKLG